MKSKPHYVIRFSFDHGTSTCFWSMNDDAYERFGYYFLPEDLPLADATIKRADEIVSWEAESLNWDYPPDPGPWRQDECDRFNQAVKELQEVVRKELGDDFELINKFQDLQEDPDLDAYLRDPKGFKRM